MKTHFVIKKSKTYPSNPFHSIKFANKNIPFILTVLEFQSNLPKHIT